MDRRHRLSLFIDLPPYSLFDSLMGAAALAADRRRTRQINVEVSIGRDREPASRNTSFRSSEEPSGCREPRTVMILALPSKAIRVPRRARRINHCE